jgi:formate dehydrogenase iron-sulfur subunit
MATPAEIHWRRFDEIEGGAWPTTQRHYLSMGCNATIASMPTV